MRIYATYCSNQQTCLDALSKLKDTRNGFETFLLVCAARPECQNNNLNSFLIKPGIN